MNATTVRLRRVVLDDLLAERGIHSINDQVKLLGVSRATWHRIRAGTHSPSFVTAIRIARALGVPVTVLFEIVEGEAS